MPAMQRLVRNVPLRAPDGLDLNLADFGGGSGPPLLFVHGSFGHARAWDFVVESLEPGRRALALDLPGHGDSAHASGVERYAFAALVGDLRVAVAAAGQPPILAGHSIGSAIAMYYAAAWSATLAAAVFMDIDPHPPDSQALHLNEVGAQAPRRYTSLEEAVARESRVARAASPGAHEHLARHGYRAIDGAFVQKFDQGFLRSVRRWDARPLLGRIRVPCLVLRGAGSTVMSESGYDDLLAGLPNVRGQLIPGATHQLHLDQPAAVAAAIEAFAATL